MITLEDLMPVPPEFRGAYLAIGNFDGVHRGHAHLIERLKARASASGAPALALTFDPQPVALLRPESAPVPLVWTERKVSLLKAAGASAVGVFHTGAWLLNLPARAFFEQVILRQFAARGMVEGPTFRFGHDRQGNVEALSLWCSEAKLDFEVATPAFVDDQIVSSTRIRHCLAEGKTAEAMRLLGRPHRIRGMVVRGAGRGAGLGFPTANLEQVDTQIPLDGVYAARALIDGGGPERAAACHIGANVTFGEQARQVEVHILDYSGELYGRRVEVDLLDRLRPTQRFENLDGLLAQMRQDVERARAIAATSR